MATKTTKNKPAAPARDEKTIMAERRAKLAALRQGGFVYPNSFGAPENHNNDDITSLEWAESGESVTTAGRMILKQVKRKNSVAVLMDASGEKANARIRLLISDDTLGKEAHDTFKNHYDVGDILYAHGKLSKAENGELSLRVTSLLLIAKAIRPLPDESSGLSEQEIRESQPYTDLLMDDGMRFVIKVRAKTITQLRDILMDQDFIEVETHIPHPVQGDISSSAVVTYHHATDRQMLMRSAPELCLKRFLLSGFERIFTLHRDFCNESALPSYTILEFCTAYVNLQWLIEHTTFLICEILQTAADQLGYITRQGHTLSLYFRDFLPIPLVEAIAKYAPQYTVKQLRSVRFMRTELKKLGIECAPKAGIGAMQLALFRETTEAKLIEPTVITDCPAETSLLACTSDTVIKWEDAHENLPYVCAADTEPGTAKRFKVYILGREIACGYMELNDPEELAARLAEQSGEKNMHGTPDYIRLMEYGMPPSGYSRIDIKFLLDVAMKRQNRMNE